jgi:hypothetical protein
MLLRFLTFAGLLFLSVPLTIYGLWISVFNISSDQETRVLAFNSFFPGFLQGRWDTTLLGIAFCIGAIIISIICLKSLRKLWKTINVLILIISSFMLFLNLFSMM